MSSGTDVSFAYVRNQILRELTSRDLGALLPSLESVPLDLKTVIQHAGRPIEHVYFVESGTVSMITMLNDGTQAEVGLVGREGVVGLPLVLGSPLALHDALIQVSGTARRMPASTLTQALTTFPTLRAHLLAYANLFHLQVSQTAACNACHPIHQRLARWLLMTADRVEDEQFPMTQDFMSRMLAVQRPGVNLALTRLRRAGLVQHQKSWLKVIDRRGLEAASCECYAIVRDQFLIMCGPRPGN